MTPICTSPASPSCRTLLVFIATLCSLTSCLASAAPPPLSCTFCMKLSKSRWEAHSAMALSMTAWHWSSVTPWLMALFSKCFAAFSSSLRRSNASRRVSRACLRPGLRSEKHATAASNCWKPSKPSLKPPCCFRKGSCCEAMNCTRSSPRFGSRSARMAQKRAIDSSARECSRTLLQMSFRSSSLNLRNSDVSPRSAEARTSSANFLTVSEERREASSALQAAS
mmetsp:Transcript_77753/g.251644  ORF Transcript_77753/g.251644 Transcript_77753/m.251644 type:complete len:224 (+) Transcript_77753:131-802(+)